MLMNELQAWNQWGELCELARCENEAQDILNCIGVDLLRKGMARLPDHVRNNLNLDREYGFALLELFSLARHHTERTQDRKLWGKSYKQAMFKRAREDRRPTDEMLRRLAFPMLRSAVREAWLKEAEQEDVKSLSTPAGDREALTLEDSVADLRGDDDPAFLELLQIAQGHVDEVFAEMPFIHRVILLARALGIPYSNSPAVQDVTGKGASSLGDQFKYIYRRCDYRHILVEQYPEEDSETLDVLYRMVLGYCEQRAVVWGHSEKRCAALFAVAEENDRTGGMAQ